MTDADDATLPTLTVTGGPFDGQRLAVPAGQPRTIGSSEDSSLQLDLANLDLSHAQVIWDARGLLLSDLGSSTGTYVNGEKIGTDHPLQDGDRVFLGPPGSKQTAKLAVSLPADLAIPVEVPEPPELAPAWEQAPVVLSPEPEAPPAAQPAPEPPPIPLAVAAPPMAVAPEPAAPPPPRAAPQKPDYTSDIPSIQPERPREPAPVLERPPAPPAAAPRVPRSAPKKSLTVPRPVLLGLGAAVLGLVGYVALRTFYAPTPVLTSISPARAETGATVSLMGTDLGNDAGAVTVHFGDKTGKVVSASDTQVAVAIPEGLPPGGSVSVSAETRGGRSNALVLNISAAPKIASLAPDVAMPGDEVVAKGRNLNAKGIALLVGGQPADVLSSEAASLRFRVPQVPATAGQELKVVAQAAGETSGPARLYFGHLPLLLEAKPGSGGAGERVTLVGRGFDTKPSGNAVTFAGEPALVFSASENEVSVSAPTIPSSATQVQVPVVVQVEGRSSNPAAFTLVRPSRGYFLPRYFPAPVPDHPGRDDAFVSTELGPVLLLGAAGGAPSTAERAAKVAAALNALVDAAASRPVAFELRDSGGPAVAVAGSPDIVVRVLPEDAAAYDEAVDPGAKGRRPQVRTVAALWLAMLQDHMALFVAHERPTHTVETTPRGRVLLDIYAEALRRAGPGVGVPEGVVNPLPAALARGLRDMALLVPTEGQATATASVEGTWRGTMEESGTGSKGITVRLATSGGKLTGGLTTRSGKLGAEVPLKDVGYDRGTSTLRFVLQVGGTPRYFSGTLQGDTIAGTIRADANAKDAVGQFSVKYVE